jgi:hypothetical protein
VPTISTVQLILLQVINIYILGNVIIDLAGISLSAGESIGYTTEFLLIDALSSRKPSNALTG